MDTKGNGDIVDLQTIDGRTGVLLGATGALRPEATFSGAATGGRPRSRGTVCLS